MTEEAGPFAGQDRYVARKGVVAEFKRLGLLEKEQEYTIPLGYCSRSHTIIEPLISMQWWVKMAPLANGALGAVKYGQTQIVPQRFTKTYTDWLENIRDWNISRQLWWGHRIPVWYCADCGEMTVSREDPTACAHCGSAKIEQDPDVLDTWFSSWLWPFSTLGWPDDTPDLRRYYPTSVLETGYDIIFFWVARMMMAGIHFLGVAPFSTIYLHGLVRDEQGRKMSKSLGNVIDPIEVMDEYGTDALRFTLATSSTPGAHTNLFREAHRRQSQLRQQDLERGALRHRPDGGDGRRCSRAGVAPAEDARRPLDHQPGAAPRARGHATDGELRVW